MGNRALSLSSSPFSLDDLRLEIKAKDKDKVHTRKWMIREKEKEKMANA